MLLCCKVESANVLVLAVAGGTAGRLISLSEEKSAYYALAGSEANIGPSSKLPPPPPPHLLPTNPESTPVYDIPLSHLVSICMVLHYSFLLQLI